MGVSTRTRITINDIDCLDPYDLLEFCNRNGYDPSRFWGLVNSLWIPRGIEPSRAFLLLPYAVLANSINPNSTSVIRIQDGASGANYLETQGWYLVRATALYPGVDPYQANQPYLAEFTDARGVATLFGAPVTKSYNVRNPEGGFMEGTTSSSGGFPKKVGDPLDPLAKPLSWTEVFNEIWALLPTIMGSPPSFGDTEVPTVPDPFPKPNSESGDINGTPNESFPENYVFTGVPALQAIGRILNDLDLTLIPPLTGGSWRLSHLDVLTQDVANLDEPVSNSSSYLIDNHTALFGSLPIIPREVEVHFPAANYQWQKGSGTDLCDMDYYRQHCVYVKRIATQQFFPPSNVTPRYLGNEGLPSTVRILLDSQLADFRWDSEAVEGGDYTHTNKQFLDAIAEKRVKRYLYSAYFGELPARFVFSGLPVTMTPYFAAAHVAKAPNGRWSAIYIHDLGGRGQSGGLRTEFLRYPRLAPSTINASIYSQAINLSKGSGSGPAWAPWATCRPGDTIGTQGITFPSSEIGAPPQLSRPAGTFVGTPFHRFAYVRPKADIVPGSEGACQFLFFKPAVEGDELPQSDLPYVVDGSVSNSEESKLAATSTPIREASVFNPFTKSGTVLTDKNTFLARFDWQLCRWIAVTPPPGELLEIATADTDAATECTIEGVKHAWLANKKIKTTKFCQSWQIKAGDRVLVWHQTGPNWLIIQLCKAETDTLDVVTDVRCESESINPDTGAVERRLVMDKVNITVISINEDPAAPAPAPPAAP